MDTCVFCRIINKEIPSYVIYEDDNVLAMLAKDMEVYGHTLIIPKQHYQDIYDIPEDILAKLSIVAKKLANRYKDKI
ncbi:TPA: hypothetical protein DCZ39_05550 [Patescibacteria group bacterium]|nr:hypothetical protein [Candidatus Gracilibacteria bacterium]